VELNARIYACLRTKALQDELREKNIELQGMLSQMETLAVTDALTGLFNRRYCENALETEFKRAVRFGTPLSCLMLDIDHFKMINDVYGHRAGDTVLKEVARILKSGRRAIDTVARWGGEEFIVLLPQTKKEGAIIVASQFMSTLSAHVFSGISDEHVTVSIGIACVPDPSIDTGEKLVNASDCALYEAKRKGRNRIESA
jgi:diguanylate cyclase (GGDEF)-like protein